MIFNNTDVLGLRFYLKGNIHAIAINRVSKYRYGWLFMVYSYVLFFPLLHVHVYIKTIGATHIEFYNFKMIGCL